MNFAAIDIGSNAVRLLFSNITEHKGEVYFNKASLVRMPVRLGTDVFLDGKISDGRRTDLVKTMQAYRNLIEVFKVEEYMAYATSALREAANGPEIIQEIKEKSGLNVQLIDGSLEAEVIYETHIAELMDTDHSYLYIDVGGGSTELTLFMNGQILASQSFKIGTVRLLENVVSQAEWQRMQHWLTEKAVPLPGLQAIGTGGNINKLFKMSKRKEGSPLYPLTLQKFYKLLSGYTFEERVSKMGLRPDRADVLIPATQIYMQVMKWGQIHEMFVPKVGLADGMIRILYRQYREGKRSMGT